MKDLSPSELPTFESLHAKRALQLNAVIEQQIQAGPD